MAYRSQVTLSLSHKLKQQIIEKGRSTLTVDDHYMLRQLLNGSDADTYLENDKGMFFYQSSIKWYPYYPEISLVEEYISKNQNEAFFARLGEAFNDAEYLGTFRDVVEVRLSSSIHFSEV